MPEFKSFMGYTVKDETARNAVNALDKKTSDNLNAVKTELESGLSNSVNTLNAKIDKANEDVTGSLAEVHEFIESERGATAGEASIFFRSDTRYTDDGDCSIIKTAEKNVVIDIGLNSYTSLGDFLNEKGITHVDYLVISHYHSDHIGGDNAEGIQHLIDNVPQIGNFTTVLLPHGDIDYDSMIGNGADYKGVHEAIIAMLTSAGIRYEYPSNEQVIRLDDNNTMKMLNLNAGDYSDYYTHTLDRSEAETNTTNYNNFSMCVMLESYKNHVFFPGDIERIAQGKMAQYLDYVDVHKVEHHALNFVTDETYNAKINPQIVVGMPRNGDSHYTFYAEATINYVQNNGATIFDTYYSGAVEVRSSLKGVNGLSERGSMKGSPHYGEMGRFLIPGTDLDTIIEPGEYFSSSGGNSATLINSPISAAGFRLEVKKQTHFEPLVSQHIEYGNGSNRTFLYRKRYNTNNENLWSEWTATTYSKIINLNNDKACVILEDLTLYGTSTTYSNYVRENNNIVDVALAFTVNKKVAASNALFYIPELVSETRKRFAAFDLNGKIYPMAMYSASEGGTGFKTFVEIPAGVTLIIDVTCVLIPNSKS